MRERLDGKALGGVSCVVCVLLVVKMGERQTRRGRSISRKRAKIFKGPNSRMMKENVEVTLGEMLYSGSAEEPLSILRLQTLESGERLVSCHCNCRKAHQELGFLFDFQR